MFANIIKKAGFIYLISVCGSSLVLLCLVEAGEWLRHKSISKLVGRKSGER
jgi:hypothetical protein